MKTVSRMRIQCHKCRYRDNCPHKQLEMAIVDESLIAEMSTPISAEIATPILQQHDYRDIKISKSMTITIDLVELKEQMRKEFYQQVGLPSCLLKSGV